MDNCCKPFVMHSFVTTWFVVPMLVQELCVSMDMATVLHVNLCTVWLSAACESLHLVESFHRHVCDLLCHAHLTMRLTRVHGVCQMDQALYTYSVLVRQAHESGLCCV